MQKISTVTKTDLPSQAGRRIRRRRFRRDYLIVLWTVIFAYYYTASSGNALPRPADSQEESHYDDVSNINDDYALAGGNLFFSVRYVM